MIKLSSKIVARAELDNVTAHASEIKDSKDLLIEFYIDKALYKTLMSKPGEFWHSWFMKRIEEAKKL